jgi:hypothetical protein
MKYATDRPYADPEKAARRILEIANAVEPIQGRIHIEKFKRRFSSVTAVARPNTARASNSRCMNPEPSSPSRRRAPSCSLDEQRTMPQKFFRFP